MTTSFKLPVAWAANAGDTLEFFEPNTTTPKAVYSDDDLETEISQPIAANSAGRWQRIYLSPGLYKVRWKTAAGVEIDTFDYEDPGLATGGSGGILPISGGGTGASTAGGALSNLGAAPQSGLDSEVSARQTLDARVVVLETASAFINPGGRLTLSTGVPVLTSDVTAAATVYYTPYIHNRIPQWDGSKWTLVEFAEVSQALSDTDKSPSAAVLNSVYDYFGWMDGDTFRVTRGPAWDSATSRGTGSGKSELVRVDGFWMNAQNITNGPLAQRGLYLGSIATDGSAQLNMMFAPSPAGGGSANRLDVWNMYNRVGVSSVNRDSTNSWEYQTATWRAANAAAASGVAFRVTLVCGLAEEDVSARYSALFNPTSGNVIAHAGIGIDATDTVSGLPGVAGGGSSTIYHQVIGQYDGLPGIGRHFIQAMEYVGAGTTVTWYGDNNSPATTRSGLVVRTRM